MIKSTPCTTPAVILCLSFVPGNLVWPQKENISEDPWCISTWPFSTPLFLSWYLASFWLLISLLITISLYPHFLPHLTPSSLQPHNPVFTTLGWVCFLNASECHPILSCLHRQGLTLPLFSSDSPLPLFSWTNSHSPRQLEWYSTAWFSLYQFHIL